MVVPSSVATEETETPRGAVAPSPRRMSISRSPPSMAASTPGGNTSWTGRPVSSPGETPARASAAPLAMATLPSGDTSRSPAGMAATTSEASAVV